MPQPEKFQNDERIRGLLVKFHEIYEQSEINEILRFLRLICQFSKNCFIFSKAWMTFNTEYSRGKLDSVRRFNQKCFFLVFAIFVKVVPVVWMQYFVFTFIDVSSNFLKYFYEISWFFANLHCWKVGWGTILQTFLEKCFFFGCWD